MKHFIKRTLFQGAGSKKPKAQPAILNPPKLGKYEILNSYSVAEIIDLISDGPIEGLVNQHGQTLGEGKSILQGVYLDNTPIEQTTLAAEKVQTDPILGYDISNLLNKFGDIYYDRRKKKYLAQYFNPPVNEKNFTTKLPESKMLISRYNLVNNEGGSGTEYFYSPLVDGKMGTSSDTWTWMGNLKTSDPRYFHNTLSGSRTIEAHYENDSLFSANTLLSSLQNDLQNDFNNIATVKYQKQWIGEVLKTINKIKNTNKDKRFKWKEDNTNFIVVFIGSKDAPAKFEAAANDTRSVLNSKGQFDPVFFDLKNFSESFPNSLIHKLLVPVMNDNIYTRNVYGCLVFQINSESRNITVKEKPVNNDNRYGFDTYTRDYTRHLMNDIYGFTRSGIRLLFSRGAETESVDTASKYNFLNVACEFRKGTEYQTALNHFSNIYVDYEMSNELYGPFSANGSLRRIDGEWDTDKRGPQNPKLNIGLGDSEGSDDVRGVKELKSYADFNNYNAVEEIASPVIHTIENPNVTSVFFTLGVSQLSDTQQISQAGREAGEKIPAIVEIEVEWGKIKNGVERNVSKKKYAIIALVEGQMLIDFGSPDLEMVHDEFYKSVRDISDDKFSKTNLSRPYKLPKIKEDENSSEVKRYIKVTKLSTETNSVLVNKDVILYKVTEIIESDLSYPFSAIAGVKIDARSFGSMPERTYDCRLKRVKIPSNYFPLKNDGRDKRYVKIAEKLENEELNLVYKGDWDGRFKIGWTDNPAWIIYDLLTSMRYGLGGYLDSADINHWELYKIGRFCDAVDEVGYFKGVPDGYGGLEPRYSCNIVFGEKTKIFDAINVVANLFRGVTFFANSEVHFLDDRPRAPIAIFSNTNVKDGFFNYINNRRDQQFNTAEIAYLDRFDNYQTKIEYVQDESDIRKRGVFKTDMNTLGVTSRAMARRIGQHLIHQTIKENQSVEFSAGLETILCKPGDLIIIEDELKTRATNYGRILSTNQTAKTIQIDNPFISGTYTGRVTVFTPTGFKTTSDMKALSYVKRSRLPYFDVTGAMVGSSSNSLSGRYVFSGYVSGYPVSRQPPLPEQFPYYTGRAAAGHSLFCYYNTGATGFVFATGLPYQNNDIYDKVITNTGVTNIIEIDSQNANSALFKDYIGFKYSSAEPSRRSLTTSGTISDNFLIEFSESFKGILNSEIEAVNNSQITTFGVTGYQNLDYGATLYVNTGDPNINLFPFVTEGGSYRLQRANATEQIYKIITIREINQNEYTVVATKYDTGKFESIENAITSEFLPETYYSGPMVINNVNVSQLPAPTISVFNTGSTGVTNFSLTGRWSRVTGSTGYYLEAYNTLSNALVGMYMTGSSATGVSVTGLSTIGQWNFQVKSLGNKNTTIDSDFAKTGQFIVYNNMAKLSHAAITNFTLL